MIGLQLLYLLFSCAQPPPWHNPSLASRIRRVSWGCASTLFRQELLHEVPYRVGIPIARALHEADNPSPLIEQITRRNARNLQPCPQHILRIEQDWEDEPVC